MKNKSKYQFGMLVFILILQSCIPLKIAPDLKEGQVIKAKKFEKKLGDNFVFAFEDPKDANEFYKYINAKFQVDYDDNLGNIVIRINSKKRFLTFYEVNKETKTINLIPLAVDTALENKGYQPLLYDAEVSRTGTWYIALTVTDDDLKDCLNPNYSSQKEVVDYLENLQKEYLTTSVYLEIYLRSK